MKNRSLARREIAGDDVRSFLRRAGMPRLTVASFALGSGCAVAALLLGEPVAVAAYVLIIAGLVPAAIAHGVLAAYDADVMARAPELFYDLAEQARSSGSLVKALKRVSTGFYGAMSDEVVRVLSEIEDEGYDLARSLDAMAGRMGNRYIDRSVALIKEALTSSPDIEGILHMISEDGRLYLTMDRERRAGILPAVVVIYLTAVIMIIVVSLCITSFVPVSRQLQSLASADVAAVENPAAFGLPYYALCQSVAICAGLTVGVMRDSSVFGGFKDAALLATAAFLIFELIVFPGFNVMEVLAR